MEPTNEFSMHWTERAELLEDAAFQGQQMPDGLSYPEQILFLEFRLLYAYAAIAKMPKEQGRAEKQKILVAYLGHCAEQMIYEQCKREFEARHSTIVPAEGGSEDG